MSAYPHERAQRQRLQASQPDDEPSVPLPRGVALQQRRLMGQLYAGKAMQACPKCAGEGTRPVPPARPGWRPQKRICPTCRGQREVPA